MDIIIRNKRSLIAAVVMTAALAQFGCAGSPRSAHERSARIGLVGYELVPPPSYRVEYSWFEREAGRRRAGFEHIRTFDHTDWEKQEREREYRRAVAEQEREDILAELEREREERIAEAEQRREELREEAEQARRDRRAEIRRLREEAREERRRRREERFEGIGRRREDFRRERRRGSRDWWDDRDWR